MRRAIRAFSILAVLGTASVAGAGTATDTLNVTANVIDVARITSVGSISFSNYDPTEPATPNDADGSVTVRATKGLAYKIYIGADRELTNGTENLTYELYSDAGRTAVWGSTSGTAVSFTSAGSAESTKNIYGRIVASQDVSAGNYSDTVTITLEW